METKTILMVEDNPQILKINQKMLTRLSGGAFSFLVAETLAAARAPLCERVDLILLDILLPDGSGLDFVPEIRAATGAPVLMLTSRREPEQIIEGLMGGGDEYMTKPYRVDELYARMVAMLRREERDRAGQVPETLIKGALTLSVLSGQAVLRGADMLLTSKEFSVLLLLAQNADKPLSAETLYETVWHMPLAGDSQAVRSVIARLRGKLQGSGHTIVSRRGGGYIFLSEEKI